MTPYMETFSFGFDFKNACLACNISAWINMSLFQVKKGKTRKEFSAASYLLTTAFKQPTGNKEILKLYNSIQNKTYPLT